MSIEHVRNAVYKIVDTEPGLISEYIDVELLIYLME